MSDNQMVLQSLDHGLLTITMGIVVVMALIVILVNFAVDVSYRISDPRIR